MKFIYLDQNKWINLAQAESGKAQGGQFVTVLQSARRAVADSRACFPLSRTHLIETVRAPRSDQRIALARLMIELSRGVVLRTTQRLAECGIRHAVREMFGLAPETHLAFGRGIDEALGFERSDLLPGRPPEFLELFRTFVDTPERWLEVLSAIEDAPRTAAKASIDKVADNWLAGCQEDRHLLQGSNANELRAILYARATVYFRSTLEEALRDIGRTFEEWGGLGRARLIAFWNNVPVVRAQSEYELALLRDKTYEYERNDLRDIGFFGVAIPYCDIVIAERQVIGVARSCKLDKVFDTVLLTDLAEIEPLLAS